MNETLNVAVDARFSVLDERGIGRYTRALIAQFLAAPDLRLSFVVPGLLAPRGRVAAKLGVERSAVVSAVPPDAAVLWSPSNGTNLATTAACVTTLHDVVPFMFPSEVPRVRQREQAPLWQTAQRARTIVADSRYMAGEIATRLDVEPGRIAVAPLGVTVPFVAGGARATLSDGRQYVLHVGAHDLRKNVRTLVAAWQAAFPTADVALAFTREPDVLPPGAVVIDAPSDERLAEFYRGALFVALPSLDEGFGLPLLEALACGVPAVASHIAALPEVGGNAVEWVDDPDNVDKWAFTFRRLSRDPERLASLAAGGPAQAAPFTWERCAGLTLDAFRAAAS